MTQEKPPTNSGDGFAATDLAILRHVALYQLTFTYPVQRLFFPEDQFAPKEKALTRAGDALAALTKLGLLTSEEEGVPLRFNKHHRYFVLTQQGAELVEAPESRTKSPAKLNEELAVLWFCTMGKKRFHRADHSEIAHLFEDKKPHHHVRHAICEEESGPVLYRLFPTKAKPQSFRANARRLLDDIRGNPTLLSMSEVGDYGLAILTPSEEYRDAIQLELRKPDGERPPLNRQARFTVRLGPTCNTLNRAIEGLKPNKPADDGEEETAH